MNDTPKLRPGLDRRTKAQRAREWKREMDALTPAERAAWELLPYSEIPHPGQARDIVAAVRPIIAAEALRNAAYALTHPDATALPTWQNVAEALNARADRIEEGTTDV